MIEGMAEADGYLHTSEYSRTVAVEKLTERVVDRELDGVVCCEDLAGNPAIGVSSVYWAGGWVMLYLAQEFGEQIHVEMLQESPIEVLTRYESSLDSIFDGMKDYLQSYSRSLGTDYTPQVACTGRYRPNLDGSWTFTWRILNNQQRPPEHQVFRFQYRQNSTIPWVNGTASGVPLYANESNVTLPLFQGMSSSPFEWRTRSCRDGSDNLCSDWSNTVQWTVASCANHR